MKDIHKFIEQTVLKPDITDSDIEKAVKEAFDFHFFGICVPPFWVQKAKREIGNGDVKLVTVIGFPLGYQMTETKLYETQLAIQNGADEIDVVWSLSAFKSGMNWPKIELAKLSNLCHKEGTFLKAIIETAYLNESEIIRACEICRDAGVDYLKTSTGFANEGAKEADIRLMRAHLPSSVGIKASGGIKTFAQAKSLIEAGADRIGTSAGVYIVADQIRD